MARAQAAFASSSESESDSDTDSHEKDAEPTYENLPPAQSAPSGPTSSIGQSLTRATAMLETDSSSESEKERGFYLLF